MMWPPPLPVRLPESDDYTALGQDESPRQLLPALLGIVLFLALLLLGTVLGRI